MKRNRFTFLTLIIVIILTVASFALVNASNDHMKQIPPGSKYLIKQELSEYANSNELKIAKEKTKKRLDDVWSDIKRSFEISDEEYLMINPDDLGTELLNSVNQFSDKEFKKKFDKAYLQFMKKMKIGYFQPVIFVKNDGSEIIIGTKDLDGNNMITISKKNGLEWNDFNYTKKGKAPLKMDDIKLD